MTKPKVVILGGGPAGVGAAYQLHKRDRGTALLIEARDHFGGNAGSFFSEDQWLDYGSHRLSSATDPAILTDIQRLLGPDLADRPRNGRIRLRGRWLKFPLQANDLMLGLDPAFAAGAARDAALKTLASRLWTRVDRMTARGRAEPRTARGRAEPRTSFASVLLDQLGPTICQQFYFPYAQKIWGQPPEALSAVQARKRVSSRSFTQLLRKLLEPASADRFFYPREGFGQISRAYAQAARELGADLRLNTKVVGLHRYSAGWRIELMSGNRAATIEADHVWSTLPVPAAAAMMHPPPPPGIKQAGERVRYRALLLVYLHLDIDRFHEANTHYFPEADRTMTRLSEPKNYFGSTEPRGRTTLCAEIPCQVDDELWRANDETLAERVQADLTACDVPLPRRPVKVQVARLPYAYPVYLTGYEADLEPLDAWISAQPNFLTYGRQGLFQHDNTHHALAMAYAAVDCLADGELDAAQWAAYRDVFDQHVVPD